MRNRKKIQQNNNGFALLLAITVASVLLALGLTMLTVTTKQLTLSSISRESEIAFQAAMAGHECIIYYRRSLGVTLTAAGASAPPLGCFDVTDDASYRNDDYIGPATYGTDRYMNIFNYRFDWGSGANRRCTEADLYIMVNDTSDSSMSEDFAANYGLEQAGVKDCEAGSICTVTVSRGYNKSCADVTAGLATVQREILTE